MTKRMLMHKGWLLAIIAAIAISFYRLPYYVSYPGVAKELAPIINVEGGYEEEGSFMLTTVRIGEANIFQYILAKFNKYQHLYPEELIRPQGESDDEYMHRQLHMMETSKESAIVVAYGKAERELMIAYNGVYVMGVIEGMPAAGVLEAGDRIHSINGEAFSKSEDLISTINKLKPGQEVSIRFERDGKEQEAVLPLASFPDYPDKVGMGISLVTDRTVVVDPNVEIDTEQIGGPSAGLMFTLEIYNQLVAEDLTKGYEIAGTGSMDYEGNVGPIGGIQQKIVAADEAGADVFFAPNEGGETDSNYQKALEAAQDIDTKMKIVPVDTFDDALNFLEKLEAKS